MTPAARITYSLVLVTGLTVGAFFGFWTDAERLKSYYSARRDIAPIELDDFSLMQYQHADAEHARTALLASAVFLEKIEALSPNKVQDLHHKVRDLHLAATYTRLALLEDAGNNAQASHDYMAKAQYWCAAGDSQKCSDSEMKIATRNLDERLEAGSHLAH